MSKPNEIAIRLFAVIGATLLVDGCTTTSINTDAAQRANATLEKLDQAEGAAAPSRYHDQETRLWRDRPQYATLVDAKPVKRMRMISAAAPSYPTMLRLGHVNAKVIVSFVVGVDGRVEDARIFESSDSRFDDSALEAIRRFTFIPAEGVNGPTREIAMQPFEFWWSAKAHPGEPLQKPAPPQ
jgi:TonB family protein